MYLYPFFFPLVAISAYRLSMGTSPAREQRDCADCERARDRFRHGRAQIGPVVGRHARAADRLAEVGGEQVEIVEVHVAVEVEVALLPGRTARRAEVAR